MKWFKHYSNAQTSSALDEIINEFGFEGYGRYWRLLEFLSSNFDGESVKFRFHNRTLRDCLRFKSRLKLSCYLVAIGLQPGFKVVENKDHYEIEASILLNLKQKDFKRARPNRDQIAPRIDKDKEKEKESRKSVPPDFVAQSVKHLNNACNRSFDPKAKATANALRKIFREGYGIDDVRAVIDFKKSEWGSSEKMEGNLKPSVLFRFSNFEKYIDEAKEKKARVKKLLEE